MIVSTIIESLRIEVGNRAQKGVDHFKYLRSVLIGAGYCKSEIRMRIAIVKKHLTEKYHS